jgi:vacuolar protein sorting-associated protein 3
LYKCVVFFSNFLGSPLVVIPEQVEDTVLAKLLAQSKLPDELYALLQEPNDVVLSEIEPVLLQNRLYRALCMIYQKHGEDDRLLDVWSKYV